MTTATHHDLLVLGSGSGNSLVTPEMAGWSVGIVEEGIFGGTCLNVGCIPTKMFVLPADRVAEAHEAARIDVTVEGARADWAAARDRIFGRIDPISEAGAAYRRDGEGTTLHQGRGRFVGPREVEVTAADGSTTRVIADRVVIATGSRPWVPEPFARALADGLPVHTSDTVMRIGAAPRRALVVGGGYIATEMAHVLSGFGASITLVVRGPQLLRDLDPSIAIPFDAIATDRWDVRHGTTANDLKQVRRLATSITRTLADLGPAAAQHAVLERLATTTAGSGPDNSKGMSLSTYVLAARLERTAELANERLSVMADGRYELFHDDSRTDARRKGGLGLKVRDLWTGDERPTGTLSGGESFVVSLALALGLADAVREESGGFDLQTLFVDEGFGTLDEDALEQVMGVLDGLRDGGRSVGIVSHVAELRQRIPTQIRLLKTQHGSTLEIVDVAATA